MCILFVYEMRIYTYLPSPRIANLVSLLSTSGRLIVASRGHFIYYIYIKKKYIYKCAYAMPWGGRQRKELLWRSSQYIWNGIMHTSGFQHCSICRHLQYFWGRWGTDLCLASISLLFIIYLSWAWKYPGTPREMQSTGWKSLVRKHFKWCLGMNEIIHFCSNNHRDLILY